MTKLKVWHWMAIIILMPCVLGSICPKKTSTPTTPQSCGIGEGQYEFNKVGTVPDSFNCNNSGRFVITLEPKINSSYTGPSDLVFNRLYFILKSGNDSLITNYVEFVTEDTLYKQLEWGGSLPTGDYKVRGRMMNIQLNSWCSDSIMVELYKDLGWIHITEHSYPQKVMKIEYYCQTSYNVFSSPHTSEYMDIAFNIANTRYNVTTYNTNLTPQIIEYSDQGVGSYILDWKQYPDEMFLCGIKAFKDIAGNLLPNKLGVTYEDDWVTRCPSCTTGSLVAVKTCIDFAVSDEYQLDYNDLVTAMTIHELGLQRGAVSDEHYSTRPYPKFCIGHEALIVWPQEEGKHPYWAVRYSNPHFCDDCITGIKNINWDNCVYPK
ncbi:MAG: hypothetical protein MUO91_04175 [candidate division Zixibacteria bacterium]|nr:hypothetical protein [candidate division Zixibacteria bacterium]